MQFYKKYSLKRHNIKYVCIKLYTLIQYMNELHTKHFVKGLEFLRKRIKNILKYVQKSNKSSIFVRTSGCFLVVVVFKNFLIFRP